MVRCQSISLWRGRRLRAARFRLPLHRLAHRVGQLALAAPRPPCAPPCAGGLPGLGRDDAVQRQQRGDQVHVRLDRLQHLRLQQHLAQVEPLQRVLLHHLHDRSWGSTRGCRPASARRSATEAAQPAAAARRRTAPRARGPCARSVAAQRQRRCRRPRRRPGSAASGAGVRRSVESVSHVITVTSDRSLRPGSGQQRQHGRRPARRRSPARRLAAAAATRRRRA